MSRIANSLADQRRAEIVKAETRGQALSSDQTWEKTLMAWQREFQMAMPVGGEAVQLIRDVMHAVRINPELAACSKESVLGGMMNLAQLGLRPGVAGQAWLVPFNSKTGKQAQVIIGYKGMAQLMWRHPIVTAIDGHVVREGEEFEYSYRPKRLEHRPPYADPDKTPPTHYYVAVDTTRGGEIWEVLTEAEGERIRQEVISKKGGTKKPWYTHPEQMKLKTAARRLARFAPISFELEVADRVDGGIRLDPSPDVRPEDATVLDVEVVDSELTDPPEGGEDEHKKAARDAT